jgi:hypothetical protein
LPVAYCLIAVELLNDWTVEPGISPLRLERSETVERLERFELLSSTNCKEFAHSRRKLKRFVGGSVYLGVARQLYSSTQSRARARFYPLSLCLYPFAALTITSHDHVSSPTTNLFCLDPSAFIFGF